MRAPRTERRRAHRATAKRRRGLGPVRHGQSAFGVGLPRHPHQNACDHSGVDLAVIRKGTGIRIAAIGIAGKGLPHDPRRMPGPVQHRANLVLQKRALLLDDQDGIETLGKLLNHLRVQRPDHTDLETPHRHAADLAIAISQTGQRLPQILPRFARRHDADARDLRPVDLVEAVCPRISQNLAQLYIPQHLFLNGNRRERLDRHVRPVVLRHHDLRAVGRDVDRPAALDHIRHQLHPDEC